MGNWRCSIGRYVLALFIVLGAAVCCLSSDAFAGGVRFGFGVDIPPPVVVERAPPPVVIERTPPPPPLVVERTPPPTRVVVERIRPDVVYEEPMVVERRSSVYYYYRPSCQYRSYHQETEREYYRQRNNDWAGDDEY